MLEKLKQIWKEQNIKFLVKFYFEIELTEKQQEIVRLIAFSKSKRIIISAVTRYGKSRSVSLGVLLYILKNKNKKVNLIAPTYNQTSILRNYIAEQIIVCPEMQDLLETESKGIERIKKEVSKSRMTFKNGCEVRVLSAEGGAERLMGFGGDLNILDESCLIDGEVYRTKISRMLGDSPDSKLVEIGNPWNRDNQMWEHWVDPNFIKVHIDYKTAIKEGRITEEFLNEQKEKLTSREFQILYEAEFPEESEDSIFKLKDINKSFESEIELNNGKKIISCDVADKGGDRTVIYWGYQKDNKFHIKYEWHEDTSENMKIVGKIVSVYREKKADQINVDAIGIGVGVVSRLKEVLDEENVTIKACHFGEQAINSDRFMNKKAENYFRLKEIFENQNIKVNKNDYLLNELTKMKWEITSSGKIKIVDPDKSPDFADALVYFIWEDKKELAFVFMPTRTE